MQKTQKINKDRADMYKALFGDSKNENIEITNKRKINTSDLANNMNHPLHDSIVSIFGSLKLIVISIPLIALLAYGISTSKSFFINESHIQGTFVQEIKYFWAYLSLLIKPVFAVGILIFIFQAIINFAEFLYLLVRYLISCKVEDKMRTDAETKLDTIKSKLKSDDDKDAKVEFGVDFDDNETNQGV